MSVDFEQGMNFCVRRIRPTLGDDGDSPRYIQTVRGRGYRFLAPVTQVATSANIASNSPAANATTAPGVAIQEPASPAIFRWRAWGISLAGVIAVIGLLVLVARKDTGEGGRAFG